MGKMNFEQSQMDPCLFLRQGKSGHWTYLAVWVDDCLIIGEEGDVKQTLMDFKEHFNITTKDTLEDYLSCEIDVNKDKGTIWIGQPDMIKK